MLCRGGVKPRLCARQIGCAFINLVEGIGHQHQRFAVAIYDALGKGKQRFARAGNGQNLTRRIDLGTKTPLQPARNGRAQNLVAARERILTEAMQMMNQRFNHEGG